MAAEKEKAIFKEEAQGRSLWTQSMRRLMRKKIGVACLVVIILFYLAGVLAAWITPYDYRSQDLSVAKQGPSLSHPFGTDRLGRDVLTRSIYGLRTVVIITVASLITGSLFLGLGLGLLSGYMGKGVDSVIMRVGEIFSSFPDFLLVLIIAATLRPRVVDLVKDLGGATGAEIVRLGIVDYIVVFGSLAVFQWYGTSRLVRGQVLSIKQSQYVEAAQAAGASTWRILLAHILPNILSPIIVLLSMSMGGAVFVAVVLGWLGIGIQPPIPDLGRMLFENGDIAVLRTNPHLLLFPVGIITVLIFAFNLLGDALNDAFNPRAR